MNETIERPFRSWKNTLQNSLSYQAFFVQREFRRSGIAAAPKPLIDFLSSDAGFCVVCHYYVVPNTFRNFRVNCEQTPNSTKNTLNNFFKLQGGRERRRCPTGRPLPTLPRVGLRIPSLSYPPRLDTASPQAPMLALPSTPPTACPTC